VICPRPRVSMTWVGRFVGRIRGGNSSGVYATVHATRATKPRGAIGIIRFLSRRASLGLRQRVPAYPSWWGFTKGYPSAAGALGGQNPLNDVPPGKGQRPSSRHNGSGGGRPVPLA